MMSRCQRLKRPHWAYRLLCGGNPAVWATQILSSWVNWVGKASNTPEDWDVYYCMIIIIKAKQQVMDKYDIMQVTGYKLFFSQKSFKPKENIVFIASILKKFLTCLKPISCFTHEPRSFFEGLADDCRLITHHFARVCHMDARDVLIFPHEHRTTLNLGLCPSSSIDCNPAKPTEGFSYISNTLLGTNISSTPRHVWVEHFPFPKVGYVSSLEGSCICKARNRFIKYGNMDWNHVNQEICS